ncbi:MAG: family 10 glycosylhydrolase [Planctomycetales bacterium]|nr:family 10 glycosylhydrolase [Planctomycetales bacterium]
MFRRLSGAGSVLPVIALTVASCQLFAGLACRGATPEVRGVWLTTTNEDHIRTGVNTAAVVTQLRNIGLNTVYVEAWKNGYTNFPSQTLQALIGAADRNPLLGGSRDLVQETLTQAHRNGMSYYAWFEYGAIAQYIGAGGSPSNPLAVYMKNRGWLLQNQAGQYADGTNGGFAYMNIAVPEVRQFLVDLTLEAVSRYDLDGVQFDDHMTWPVNFGFDATTISLYTAQTGNRAPTSSGDAQFSQWRQQQVTDFAAQLYSAVKTARPDLEFSVSPSITPFSTTNYNANWPQWESAGLFDEFAVQLYRSNISSFNSIVNAQVSPFEPDDIEKLVFGLSINGLTTTPWSDLRQMIERSRSVGAGGHSLWYSGGLLANYATELSEFYDVPENGQAANPRFVADHRPPPAVAVVDAPGEWTVEVATPGRFRVVVRSGSSPIWREYAVVQLAEGERQLSVPGASEVELLVDHRSETTFFGDFDGNGQIDGADFLGWQRGFGSTVTAGTHGDFNHDSRVDGADLPYWRLNLGLIVSPPSAIPYAVAEPSSTRLAGIVAIAASVTFFVRGLDRQ